MKPVALFKLLLAVTCAFWSAARVAAADLRAEFDAANKLYAEGKFADAAAAYDRAIQAAQAVNSASAALYFNDGNAQFKSGRLGRAIAAYRHAALIAPRDPEILGNLEFARNQVPGATVRPGHWQALLATASLDECACVAAALFWLALGLFTLRQLRPALASRLHGLTVAAVCATVLAALVLAIQAAGHFSRQTAVVTEANAIARSGPFDDGQNAFAPHDGAELSVLDRHDDWFEVTDGAGKIGWLPRRQIALLPGA